MPVINWISGVIVDACIVLMLIFIGLFVYSLYANDPTIVNMIYCQANTSSDLGYTACMTIRN